MEAYEVISTLGEGTYGVVIKAKHRSTGRIVAIKKFKQSDEDEHVRKTSLREVRLLKQLQHPNIVPLLDVFRRDGKLYIVFEFIEHTILQLLERTSRGLNPMDVRRYMYQLLRGVDFCHKHGVIHRDVKPENILVSRDGSVKLCDFGFARQVTNRGKYTDYVATRWYRAPELLVGDVSYTKAVDVWAIGCIFAELTDTRPIFPGNSDLSQLQLILRCCGPIPSYMVHIFERNSLYRRVAFPQPGVGRSLAQRYPTQSPEWIEFLGACLCTNPELRPSCEDLMNLPYFTQNNFKQEYDAYLAQKAPIPRPFRSVAAMRSSDRATMRGSGDKNGVASPYNRAPSKQKSSRRGSISGVDTVPLPSISPNGNGGTTSHAANKANTTVKPHESESRSDRDAKGNVPSSKHQPRGSVKPDHAVHHCGPGASTVTSSRELSGSKHNSSGHHAPAAGSSSEPASTQHATPAHTQERREHDINTASASSCDKNTTHANAVSYAAASSVSNASPTSTHDWNARESKGASCQEDEAATRLNHAEQPGQHSRDPVSYGKQADRAAANKEDAVSHLRAISDNVANDSGDKQFYSMDNENSNNGAAWHTSPAKGVEADKNHANSNANHGDGCGALERLQLPSISLPNVSAELQLFPKKLGVMSSMPPASTYSTNTSHASYREQKEVGSNHSSQRSDTLEKNDEARHRGRIRDVEDENKAGSKRASWLDAHTLFGSHPQQVYLHPTKLLPVARKQLSTVDTNTMMPSSHLRHQEQQEQAAAATTTTTTEHRSTQQQQQQQVQPHEDETIATTTVHKSEIVSGPPYTASSNLPHRSTPHSEKGVASMTTYGHKGVPSSHAYDDHAMLNHDKSRTRHNGLYNTFSDVVAQNLAGGLPAKLPQLEGSSSNSNHPSVSHAYSYTHGFSHFAGSQSDSDATGTKQPASVLVDGAAVSHNHPRAERHGDNSDHARAKGEEKESNHAHGDGGMAGDEERRRVRVEPPTLRDTTWPPVASVPHSRKARADGVEPSYPSYVPRQQPHEVAGPSSPTARPPSSSSHSTAHNTHQIPTSFDCDRYVDRAPERPIKIVVRTEGRHVYPVANNDYPSTKSEELAPGSKPKEKSKSIPPLSWGSRAGNVFWGQRILNSYGNHPAATQRVGRNSRLLYRDKGPPQNQPRMVMSNTTLNPSFAPTARSSIGGTNTTVTRDTGNAAVQTSQHGNDRDDNGHPLDQRTVKGFASPYDKNYSDEKRSSSTSSHSNCNNNNNNSAWKGSIQPSVRDIYGCGRTSGLAGPSNGGKLSTASSSLLASPFATSRTKHSYKSNVTGLSGERKFPRLSNIDLTSSDFAGSERGQAGGHNVVPRAKQPQPTHLAEQFVSGKLLSTPIKERINNILQRTSTKLSTRQRNVKN